MSTYYKINATTVCSKCLTGDTGSSVLTVKSDDLAKLILLPELKAFVLPHEEKVYLQPTNHMLSITQCPTCLLQISQLFLIELFLSLNISV